MAMSRRTFINTCLGLGVIAVAGRQAARADVHRERWYLFGTLVDVTISGVSHSDARSMLAALSTELQRRNRDWHPWKPGVMRDINNAIASRAPIRVDRHMAHMLEHVRQLHQASDGLFNPAIGRVVAHWGFHGGTADGWHTPRRDVIDRLIASRPSPMDLQLSRGWLRSTNPDVQIDLGGYAKGYAIDLGRRLIAEQGVEHALINAGGDLVTLGSAPQGVPWNVAIRHPQRAGRIAWLTTAGGEAVFTSGSYERFREAGGRRYPHIIDPRSGEPVRGIASATVVHADPALADAAATALVVAGPGRWRDVADRLDVDLAMVVDDRGRVSLTPAMHDRVRLDG